MDSSRKAGQPGVRGEIIRVLTPIGFVLLPSLGWGGCKPLSESLSPLPALPAQRGVCVDQVPPPQCGQTCQDSNVGFAIDNAGWLLYNQNVAGKPASALPETVSCPLSGTANVSGSASRSSNGVDVIQLTFNMTNCGVSAASYSLTFTGALQMNGTFTPSAQNDITFSSSSLSITGQLNVLDNPSVKQTCPVSMTDTWNHDPKEVGWLNGMVCGRNAGDSNSGSASVQPVPDTKCLLDSMRLTENGQPVQFDDIADNAIPAPDGGVDAGMSGGAPAMGSTAPEITSAPASLAFDHGAAQSLDLAFTDPTASRPAFVMTFRPHGNHPCKLQCGGFMCCCGCRSTHRKFDHTTVGTVHYEVSTASDPTTTADGDLLIAPVSCAEPGGDPASGSGCTPLTGALTGVGITFGAPSTSSGSSGGSSSGSSSGSNSSSSGGSSSTPARSGTETCTVTSDPITCCSGGQCNTVPSMTTTSSTPVNVPAGTSLPQSSQSICSTLMSSASGAGGLNVTCNVQNLTANSFTVVLTWTVNGNSGCNSDTFHETCDIVLQ